MQTTEALTAEQISAFLKGSLAIEFAGQNRAEIYAWTEQTLVAHQYHSQSKKQRGALRAYISKVTNLSLPQVTRLVRQHRQDGRVEPQRYLRRQFAIKYTEWCCWQM